MRSKVVLGVDFELTRLRVQDQYWWTLGLEAFGRAENLRESLLWVAAITLQGDLPMPLASQDWYAYPDWLNTVR